MIELVGKYRVRRDWRGRCILQKCINSPSLIGGSVAANVRDIHWADVDFNHAPVLLAETTS
jgi:hypothetical protein